MDAIWVFNGVGVGAVVDRHLRHGAMRRRGPSGRFRSGCYGYEFSHCHVLVHRARDLGLSSLALALALWLAARSSARQAAALPLLPQAASARILVSTLVTSLAWVPLMAWAFQGLRAGAPWASIGVGLFVLAWGTQKLLLPGPAGLVTGTTQREMQFVQHKDQGGPLCALAGKVLSPLVMPPVWETADREPRGERLSAQCSMPWHSDQPPA